VDIKAKIVKALNRSIQEAHIRLDDDKGISGVVVSPQFQGMSSYDRQGLIEDALSKAPDPLTPAERRRVLMIAGLTPVEFDAVGAPVRVHRIKEKANGTVEILLHGGLADAEYIRGALQSQKDVQTTEPKHSPGALGVLMFFQAKGTEANPVTKEKVLRVLQSDPYIQVMPNA
jgi:hypothetical protein